MFIKMLTMIKEEHDIRALYIKAPVNFGEEDIPNNFPGRQDNTWTASIDVDKGQIQGYSWPTPFKLDMKVTDEGLYALINEKGERVLTISKNYVPWGDDYLEFTINPDGTIEGGIKTQVSKMVAKSQEALQGLIGEELQ